MRAKGSGQSALFLLDIIPILEQHRIPYAIIGAFAASFYGAIRASLDADALIYLKDKNVQPLLDDVQKMQFNVKYTRGDREDPVQGEINIEDRFLNRVDLIMGIRGMDKEVFERSVKATFMEETICVISLEDFIAMKIFAGSPKDIQDCQDVMEVSKESVHRDLLEKLALNYGKEVLKKVRELL